MRFVFVLGCCLLACFQLPGESGSAVTGEYLEARSGEVYTCGCLFSSEQVSGGREAILAWKIQEGEYRGTPLAGLKAVAVIIGDGNLGLNATSRRSVLYVTSESTPNQRQAVLDLLSRHYGEVLGEIMAVHPAAVSLWKDNGETHVRVGDDIVSVVLRATRLPEDAHSGSSLWYGPFIPVEAPALATTLYFRFWGPDFRHQWWTNEPGITAYTGDFTLSDSVAFAAMPPR